MNWMLNSSLILAGLFALTSCQSDHSPADHLLVHYNFEDPLLNIPLPSYLEEVSGLSYLGDSMVVCVQDEDGILYWLSLASGAVTRKIRFGGQGDYEGVEFVNDTFYVIKSNGTIYVVAEDDTGAVLTKKVKTFLTKSNNAEGIGLHPNRRELWIACKGHPGSDESLDGTKTVYAYNLKENRLIEKPPLIMVVDSIRQYAESASLKKGYERLSEFFDPEGGNITFQPSGIAFHPITGHAYVISSVGKLIVVFDTDGNLAAVSPLTHPSFKQPEGITFLENGDLVLANEGKGGKANLMVFEFHPLNAED